MPEIKPFSWVVRFTVAPLWVADGFALCNERAQAMLMSELGGATSEETAAEVLEAPSALHIATAQGYTKNHPSAGKVVRDLRDSTPQAGVIWEALIAARKLLDSVAFVAVEGDTAKPLAKLNAAIDAIYPRRGEPVALDA